MKAKTKYPALFGIPAPRPTMYAIVANTSKGLVYFRTIDEDNKAIYCKDSILAYTFGTMTAAAIKRFQLPEKGYYSNGDSIGAFASTIVPI